MDELLNCNRKQTTDRQKAEERMKLDLQLTKHSLNIG
jgi:hypothetical protein